MPTNDVYNSKETMSHNCHNVKEVERVDTVSVRSMLTPVRILAPPSLMVENVHSRQFPRTEDWEHGEWEPWKLERPAQVCASLLSLL